MHSTDTNGKFLELRAKGWSLARIATQIGVSKRTLVNWQHQHRQELRLLRAVELEALQEKILASHKAQLTRLAGRLEAVEIELRQKNCTISAPFLHRLPRPLTPCHRRTAEQGVIIADVRRINHGDELHSSPARILT